MTKLGFIALVSKDSIKPAAETFLNWAISDGAMKLYAQERPITAVETDLPIPEGFPADPVAQLLDKDFPWIAANRERILKEWRNRYSDKVEPTD